MNSINYSTKYKFVDDNLFLIAKINPKTKKQCLVFQQIDKESRNVIFSRQLTCIHTAVTRISIADYESMINDDSERKKFNNNLLNIISTENLEPIDLELDEKYFAFKSWVQGIAESGLSAILIQDEIERMALINNPISIFLSSCLIKAEPDFIDDYLALIKQSCKNKDIWNKGNENRDNWHRSSLIASVDRIITIIKELDETELLVETVYKLIKFYITESLPTCVINFILEKFDFNILGDLLAELEYDWIVKIYNDSQLEERNRDLIFSFRIETDSEFVNDYLEVIKKEANIKIKRDNSGKEDDRGENPSLKKKVKKIIYVINHIKKEQSRRELSYKFFKLYFTESLPLQVMILIFENINSYTLSNILDNLENDWIKKILNDYIQSIKIKCKNNYEQRESDKIYESWNKQSLRYSISIILTFIERMENPKKRSEVLYSVFKFYFTECLPVYVLNYIFKTVKKKFLREVLSDLERNWVITAYNTPDLKKEHKFLIFSFLIATDSEFLNDYLKVIKLCNSGKDHNRENVSSLKKSVKKFIRVINDIENYRIKKKLLYKLLDLYFTESLPSYILRLIFDTMNKKNHSNILDLMQNMPNNWIVAIHNIEDFYNKKCLFNQFCRKHDLSDLLFIQDYSIWNSTMSHRWRVFDVLKHIDREEINKKARKNNIDSFFIRNCITKVKSKKNTIEELVKHKTKVPKIGSIYEFCVLANYNPKKLKRWLAPQISLHKSYIEKKIPKRKGGYRTLHIPYPKLKRIQVWIKEEILDKLPALQCATGFIKNKSTKNNAKPHCQKKLIIKMDLMDFFPSIKFWQIYRIFRSLRYIHEISIVLTYLCTVPLAKHITHKGNQKEYFLETSFRFLPQGAPTSPGLSNLVLIEADKELQNLTKSLNMSYTRYADDLTFSVNDSEFKIRPFIQKVFNIVRKHHFWVNKKKIKILRPYMQQRVTGLVVNKEVHIPRSYYMRIRGILHKLENYGSEMPLEERKTLKNMVSGMIAYMHSIQPRKAEKMINWYNRIKINVSK
ncbi:MAG: hypothetical protein GF364_02435 [Candidatus Lokiarchaeota archaeon]|nr:hypothetical protein [Candidatus Lokiarchaeota archaeon]